MPAVRPAALIQSQLFAALVLGVAAFAIVMAVRLTGHIEHLEMVAYDKFVVWRHAGAAAPPGGGAGGEIGRGAGRARCATFLVWLS